jgi:putative toxin-antitoxin system antitoxin component (TIGR02293 family)
MIDPSTGFESGTPIKIEGMYDPTERTIQRRAAASGLKRGKSDRLTRVARVYALAETVLGSREAAERWMLSPNWALDGVRPIDQIDSDIPGREIEDALGRIADGGFA